MRRLKQSDPSYMHIPFHIVGVCVEVLAKNFSCQDYICNVCINVIHYKWSFWLNRIARRLGKRRNWVQLLHLLCVFADWSGPARTGAKYQAPLWLKQRFLLGQPRKTSWIGREDSNDRACQIGHFWVICWQCGIWRNLELGGKLLNIYRAVCRKI